MKAGLGGTGTCMADKLTDGHETERRPPANKVWKREKSRLDWSCQVKRFFELTAAPCILFSDLLAPCPPDGDVGDRDHGQRRCMVLVVAEVKPCGSIRTPPWSAVTKDGHRGRRLKVQYLPTLPAPRPLTPQKGQRRRPTPPRCPAYPSARLHFLNNAQSPAGCRLPRGWCVARSAVKARKEGKEGEKASRGKIECPLWRTPQDLQPGT